jgi:hypothetical protein
MDLAYGYDIDIVGRAVSFLKETLLALRCYKDNGTESK